MKTGLLCQVDRGADNCESAKGGRIRSECDLCHQPACKHCSIAVKDSAGTRMRICMDCSKGEFQDDFEEIPDEDTAV